MPRRIRHRYSAKSADKYELYQKAVQSPETDIALIRRIFRCERGREPRHLREDFCGTALISSHWVRRHRENTAEGFDLDPQPLAWGLKHNCEDLDLTRLTLHELDVRAFGLRRPDVRIALNFSYWVFHERPTLLAYFRATRRSLAKDGLFLIDLYGGLDAPAELEERRRCGGFTYVWDQHRYWPGTAEYTCFIRFEFPDGSELEAFRYDWRLWTLCELRDLLVEAGFAKVERYFEGAGDKGEGDGIFRRGMRGENCAGWLAYLAAWA
ncbi:MAG: class I SAM-dependent methyltransferase [Planctomycetes bacterium]|nr:class I SAM-dependent methyltransferase [Planctomycetota bacterium]